MGQTAIKKFCLEEVDRLTYANQLFEATLVRMRDAATAPLLTSTIGEQIAVNTRVGIALKRIHDLLDHSLSPLLDAGANGLAVEARAGIDHPDSAVRDVAIAQAAVRMDHWEIAGFTGLSSFLRQVLEDEAADQVDRIVDLLGIADRHLEALRPSLTDLAHDDEAHGHETRSPEERAQPFMLGTS